MKSRKRLITNFAIVVALLTLILITLKTNQIISGTRAAEEKRLEDERLARKQRDAERYQAMSDEELMRLFKSNWGDGVKAARAAIAAGVCRSDCNRFLSELVMQPSTDESILIDLVDATDKITTLVYYRTLSRERIDLLSIMLYSGKYQPEDCRKLNEDTLLRLNEQDTILILLLAKLVRERGPECLSPVMIDFALSGGKLETANWLMNEGVEVSQDAFRSYMAGANTSLDMFNRLIAKGADLNNKVSGKTPLDRVLTVRDEGVTMQEVRLWMSLGAQVQPIYLEIFQAPQKK